MTLLDRHPDGVLEMLLFNRLGGGKISVCLNGDTLQRYTATTGFAGISTDAALPLSKAASVLSRVFGNSPKSVVYRRNFVKLSNLEGCNSVRQRSSYFRW